MHEWRRQVREIANVIDESIANCDATDNDWCFDTTPGTVIYPHFDPARFCKYVRPVRRV